MWVPEVDVEVPVVVPGVLAQPPLCVWVHFVGAFGAATAGIDPLPEAVGDVEGGVALWERADERLVARPPKRGHPEPA